MTKRDLFIVLIKIFGLYWIVAVLLSKLPGNIAFVLGDLDLTSIAWLILSMTISIGLFYILIKSADKVSNILKLEEGFDEERIDFGALKSLDIIKITVLIIGGFLFLDNIPTFLSYTFFAFKSTFPDQTNSVVFQFESIEGYITYGSSALNILVGFLFVKYFKNISLFLNQKIK